jgi:hypothetical protein
MYFVYTADLAGFMSVRMSGHYIPVFAFFPFYFTPLPPRVLVLHVGVAEGPSGFVWAWG